MLPLRGMDLGGATATVQSEIGQGEGEFQMVSGEIHLSGQASRLAPYDDNMEQNSCLLNYLLVTPIPLSPQSKSLSLLVDSPASNTGANLQLKVIVLDADKRLWAVGTRLGGSRNSLVTTNGFEPLITYAWNLNELGRLDRWVAAPLDPAAPHDGYQSMKLPLSVAGFQVGVGVVGKDFRIGIKDIEENGTGVKPDPYWLLTPQFIWNLRLGKESASYGRFGFGSKGDIPFLSSSDLHLSAGDYQVCWEILGADEWTPFASGTQEWNVQGGDTETIKFPLLAEGSYQLRLSCAKKGTAPPQEFALSYVVVRNGKPTAPPLSSTSASAPLSWSSNSPRRNVWSSAPGASLTIQPSSQFAPNSRLDWKVESSDGSPLKTGSEIDGHAAAIDLSALFHDHEALWITATLFSNGNPVDVSHRVVGLAAPAPAPATGEASGPPKISWFKGEFRRAKGDYNEGGTPVASRASQVDAMIEPWLDEAAQNGYNAVELSASWYDLNPLPGVYQFEYLDRIIAAAEKRGLAITLRVHPRLLLTPSWVPRELMEDEGGFVHGLWSGSSMLLYSPASKIYSSSLDDFLQALAAHYRKDPMLLGVTLESLFFDHDLLDLPWCAQNVDYSETMRHSFIEMLRRKYQGDLAKAAAAHDRPYRSWEEIEIPHPNLQTDGEGRIEPRTDALWRDWVEHKVDTIRDFRLDGARALRRGDPACYVAFYNTNTSPLYLDDIQKENCEVTFGSMESQFPPADTGIPGRFEPIAKTAWWPTLADVGMTNILMTGPPGFDSLFNYWQLSWRLDTVNEATRSAELRLKQWFSIIDSVMGAKPLEDASSKKGAYLVSQLPLLYSYQHTYTGRTEDVNKPFLYRIGADKVQFEEASPRTLSSSLQDAAYFYIPYWDDVMDRETLAELHHYVAQGGVLIAEGTSGFWQLDSSNLPPTPNALGTMFGLPPAIPAASNSGSDATEAASWTKNMAGLEALRGVPLAFRIHPFSPPIDNQKTPWIQNIPGAYLHPYRFASDLPANAMVVATFVDGSPAAVVVPYGKGKVLFFCGTLDWIGCPGLSSSLEAWATGGSVPTGPVEDPKLITRAFHKGSSYLLVGRRFIGQPALTAIMWNTSTPPVSLAENMEIHFPELPADHHYQIRELLSQKSLGTLSGDQLSSSGITLSLQPGEGFVLEATDISSN